MNHPSFGPFTPAEFKKLIDLSWGQARKRIQAVDPLWGCSPIERLLIAANAVLDDFDDALSTLRDAVEQVEYEQVASA